MEEDALQRSIVMIKSGDYEGGADILYSLVELEPENELAWLWLAACIENTEEKIFCLNQVLAINSENEVAQEALNQLMLSPDVDNIVPGQAAADGRATAAERQRKPRPRSKKQKKQKINTRTLIIGAVVVLVVGCIAVAGVAAAGWYLWTNF